MRGSRCLLLLVLLLLVVGGVEARLIINGVVYKGQESVNLTQFFNGTIDASNVTNPPWVTNVTIQNYYVKNETFNQSEILGLLLNYSYNDSNLTSLLFSLNGSVFGLSQDLLLESLLRVGNDSEIRGLLSLVNASLLSGLENESLLRIGNDSLLHQRIDNLSGNVSVLEATALRNTGVQTLWGDLNIFGDLRVVGSLVNLTVEQQLVNGSILPSLSGLFDIGSPSSLWNVVYANSFVGFLNASYVLNAPWLLADDQRYNDSVAVSSVNATAVLAYDGVLWLNSSKLDVDDQRYNDTALFAALNGSLAAEVLARIGNDSLKLDVDDQRYNETAFVLGLLSSYYNISEVDALLANVSFNESDPLFVAANASLWAAIDGKLNISDQRYNDTALIYGLLADYYNVSEVDAFVLWLNVSKLGVDDQRYNDSVAVSSVNATAVLAYDGVLWLNSSKLDVADQRYNDTALIVGLLASYYNVSEVDALVSWLNSSKLDVADQRYNDTALIAVVNGSLVDYRLLAVPILASEVNKTTGSYFLGEFLDVIVDSLQGAVLSLSGQFGLLNASLQSVNATAVLAYDGVLWLNSSKLDVADQRYNDTALIFGLLADYYNVSEVDAFVSWLNVSKLDVADQRYNDTALIVGLLASYYNVSEVDALIGNISFNESDPLFVAANASLWAAIDGKLNISDQRYNDTALVFGLLADYYNASESDIRYVNVAGDAMAGDLNMSWFNITGVQSLFVNTVFAQSLFGFLNASYVLNAPWLLADDQRYNDTALIAAVNVTAEAAFAGVGLLNVSKLDVADQRYNNTIRSFNLSLSVLGNGTNVSVNLTRYNIKQVLVIPPSNVTSYNFALSEVPSGVVIDRDRVTHTGEWSIRKDFAVDGQLLANVSNSSSAGEFLVVVRYLNNDAPNG